MSNIKAKQVKMDNDAKKVLADYASYLSSRRKIQYTVDDTLASILLDKEFVRELQGDVKKEPKTVSVSMPKVAWENFDLATKIGLRHQEIVERASKRLLRDRRFLKWRHGLSS